MYYYLIDPKQYEGKNFEFTQTQLLSLLTEYHVGGEAARVTALRTVEDLTATALSHGTKTLVVVGGDETFGRVMTVCRDKEITLAFVALNTRSEIAKILGIGHGLEGAVAAIAKRLVETIDMARIDNTHFISNIYFEQAQGCEFVLDGSFHVRGDFLGGAIINMRSTDACRSARALPGNPKDGVLDVAMAGRLSRLQSWMHRKKIEAHCYDALPGSSIMHGRKIEIKAPVGLKLMLSGVPVATAPAVIEVVPEKLRVVVGKSRQF